MFLYQVAFVALWLPPGAFVPAAKTSALPSEIEGIWTIIKGEEDGKAIRFAHEERVAIGETVYNQIIIYSGRWIMVDNWGGALVFRAKLVATEPKKRIEIWGDRAETKKESVSYVSFRLKGDELILCVRADQ